MSQLEDALNEIAEKYHFSENIEDKEVENLLQEYSYEMIKSFFPNSDSSVLELGYGDGIVSNLLNKDGYNFEVVEGSSFIINTLKKNNLYHGKMIHSLFENFNPNKTYDVVLASHVLEHVDDPVQLLNKIKNWVKPKTGKIIIIVPNAGSIHRLVGVKMGFLSTPFDLNERDKLVGHQRVYDIDSLRDDVQSSGLFVEKISGYFLKTMSNKMLLSHPKEYWRSLLEISSALDPKLLANLVLVASRL